jgi:hypothetical protein
MYDTFVSWIGLKTCSFAGDLVSLLDTGPACFASQAWNMGALALAVVALTFVVMVINARRRHHRDNYFRK